MFHFNYQLSTKYFTQLEMISNLLSKRTPIDSRLSLLLIDNLTELLLYNKVKEIFEFDNISHQIDRKMIIIKKYVDEKNLPHEITGNMVKPKYSLKKQEKIKSYFKEKCTCALRENLINSDEKEILIIGHEFRNEAYHNGIIRDSIILYVSQIYLEVLCKLIPSVISGFSIDISEKNKLFCKKYGVNNITCKEDLEIICNQFLNGNECEVKVLNENLSMDIKKRIETIFKRLKYISINIYNEKISTKDIFKRIQFSIQVILDYWNNDGINQETKENIEKLTILERYDEIYKIWDSLFENFNPKHKLKHLELYMKKACSMKDIELPGKALRSFIDIDKNLLKISEMVNNFEHQFEKNLEINNDD